MDHSVVILMNNQSVKMFAVQGFAEMGHLKSVHV